MGGDPAKGFVIGGISAGGNLATVISHLYRDEKMSPPLTGIYLSVPILVSPEAVPGKFKYQYLSREQNKNAPILNKEAMALFRGTSRLYIAPNSDFGMAVHDSSQPVTRKIQFRHSPHPLSSPPDTKTYRRRISKFVAWIPCVTTISSMSAS